MINFSSISALWCLRYRAVLLGVLVGLAAAPAAEGQSFGPPTSYSIGSDAYPYHLAVGDLNSDGIPDLVGSNSLQYGYGNAKISVLLGRSAGGYSPPVFYSTGAKDFAQGIGLGDVTGDGLLDAVVAVTTGIKVFPGGGDGTFSAPNSYPSNTSLGGHAILLNDLNKDGKLDVIVSGSTDAFATVYLRQGSDFAAPATYQAGFDFAEDMALGDITGDGKDDLVVANFTYNTVSVLPGRGNGTFALSVTYTAGLIGKAKNKPISVALADLNKDGRLDVVTANYGTTTVGVMPGKADGTLGAMTTYPSGGNYSSICTRLGDVNGDGRLDAIISNSNGSIGMLLGKADGTFGTTTLFATTSSPQELVLRDLNLDGRLDVVTADYAASTLTVLLNTGSYVPPGFAPPIATNDTGTTSANTTLNGSSVLANDTRGAIRVGAYDATTSQGGTVSFNTTAGTYTYLPPNNFSGMDTFTYRALDNAGVASNPATVTITVTPEAGDDTYSVAANVRAYLDKSGLLSNDFGSELSIIPGSTTSSRGFAVDITADYVSYFATSNFNGSDSFTYSVRDASGTTAIATVTIIQQGPLVTIIGPPGPSTSSAPISITVAFTSNVADFDATDVSIDATSGTIVDKSFYGSGTTYSFRIQPQDVPQVNVTFSIPTGAAHDAAGNASSAATFTIQYVRPTTTTRKGNNNDWFSATSWDNGVPTRNIDAVVPAGLFAYIGGGNAQARSLTVGAGANVLQGSGTLELTGNLVSQGSVNSGTYLRELVLTGSSNQTITNGQSLNLAKLTVGPAGATLNGPVTISQLLTLKGDLGTNNQTLRLVTNNSASGANPALVDNAGGVVQGPATIQRAINGNNKGLGYRHYSPPVTGATVASLTTTSFTPEVSQASLYNTSATPGRTVPFPTVYAYDQSRLASVTNDFTAFDKGFVVPGSLNAPLLPGQGYAVNIAGTEVVSFVGTLNNGDYPVALTRVAGNADAGWALVGNPYPAILDWNLTTRTSLDDAFYVVQSTGQYMGGYSGYVNGLAVNNGSQFVAPGQGFFVRVADDQTTGSITFTNAARTVTAAPTAFQRPTAETRPVVRLALTGGGLTDEAVIYAEAGATPAFDRSFDAVKLSNPTGLNLSSISAGGSLAIDGRAVFTPTTTLPLGVGVPTAGAYILTAAALDNLPGGLTAYLRDAQTGQTTKLTAGTSYNFRVSAEEAQALVRGRFTVVFSPQTALATTPSLSVEAVSVYPNPAHASFAVTMPGVTRASAVQAELVNTLGQVVRQHAAALPSGGTSFSMSTAELAAGVYVLRLQAGDTTLTKRVVVQ
jgi:hypothetical protein